MSDKPNRDPRDQGRSISEVKDVYAAATDEAKRFADIRNEQRKNYGRLVARKGWKGMEFTLEYPKAWPNADIRRDGKTSDINK